MTFRNHMLNSSHYTDVNPFVSMRSGGVLLVSILFALIVLGVGFINVTQADPSLFLIHLTFLCFLGVLAIPIILYRKKGGWFHPLIFTVLWWGVIRDVLPRLDIYSNGLKFHRVASNMVNVDLDYLVVLSLLLKCLGYIALYAGYMSIVRLHVPRVEFRQPKFLHVKILTITGISVAAFYILVSEAGGIGSLMLQRGIANDLRIQAELGGHWFFLVGILKTACLVWLAIKPKIWRDPLFIALFLLSLFMLFAATGSRSGVILPIIIAVVIWSLHYREMPYGKGLLVCVVGIIAIGVLGEFREASRGAKEITDVQIESGIMSGVERGTNTIVSYAGESDGFYGILSKVPEEVEFLGGKSYLSIPAAPIPRAIWPDKPEAGGRLNATYIFANPLTTIPPGNIGEAYWNFHVPGVIVIMFLFGMILKWLARLYMTNARSGWAIAIYTFTLFSLQPSSDSFYSWLHMIVPVIVFIFYFQGMPRKTNSLVVRDKS